MRSGWLVVASTLLISGCGAGSITDDEAGESGESDEGSDWGGDDLPLTVNKDVDILFVIDNSGSMGEEQAILAANMGAFIEVLEDEAVEANYRIGVTTTDNGNPWCPAGTTTPEAGKLVMSSCKTRLGDFLFGDTVDVRDLACNDICTLSESELEVLPTVTDVDPNPAARPWLENIEGKKNIPEGTSAAEAFKCFGPQGVNGCGFESPLESMYRAFDRAQTKNEASYGFLRESAILAIVILSDEADCSSNPAFSTIFEQDGNKVFWSNPNASFPTSAVCWNAGVRCMGDPSNYDSCNSINKGVNGELGVGEADAVMYPVSRYLDRVQAIEDAKQDLNPDQEVIVALIGGVGSDGSVFYADASVSDPGFQDSFGIGPGCTGANGVTGVPPVRMREFSDAFTPNNLFSICDADYTPALEAIAKRIRDQIDPACFSGCVRDIDPLTPILEADCSVLQDPPGPGSELVPECKRGPDKSYTIDPMTDDYAMPSDQVNVCHVRLVDSNNLSPDPNDDMSPECSDRNYNLELKIVRRPGFPAPGGTAIETVCSLSEFPQVDCPNLGG